MCKYLLAIALPACVAITGSRCYDWLSSNSAVPSPNRFQRGRALFEMHCCGCHSMSGTGERRLGPPLHDIGKIGAERKPGMTAPAYILESILDPGAYRAPGTTGGMPAGILNNYGKSDIRQVVGFLASQGAVVQDEELDNLDIPDFRNNQPPHQQIDVDKVKRGEIIFRGKGKCITCHLLRDEPALTLKGPSLLDIGSLSAKDLRQAIENPNAKIGSAYQQVIVEKKNGVVIAGRLVAKNEKGIHLLIDKASGLATEFVPFTEMERSDPYGHLPYVLSKISTMPDTKNALTSEEIDALVVFLKNRLGGWYR
jgi:putative heme-binding domain-containing protein